MWRLWLILGSAVWLITISASAAVNYLAGFELGRTPAEAHVYALIGVGADLWKAVGPLFIFALWRARRFVPVLLGLAVWVLCFSFAVSAALGLAAENRSARSGGEDAVRISYEDSQRALSGLEEKRAGLGTVGARADHEGAIAVLLAQPVVGGTVGSLSQDCGKDHPRTRQACLDVAREHRELARIAEAEDLDRRIAEQRRQIAQLRKQGGAESVDPQAKLISRLSFGRIAVPDVGVALSLLVVAMVELMSAFGPVVLHEYVGSVRGRTRKVAASRVRPRQGTSGRGRTEVLKRVGDLYEYLRDRVVPDEEGSVAVTTLFADYHAWCAQGGCASMPVGTFIERLDEIARADLAGCIRRNGTTYWGFRLVRQHALPAPQQKLLA